MDTALLGYDRQGLARLVAAIENGPPPEPPPLEQALEASHCAFEQWQLMLAQLEQAADWDRGQLGLLADGNGDELTARQEGARTFLRHLAATMLPPTLTTVSELARELHGMVYGSKPTDVMVSDLVEVLHGTQVQPSVLLLQEVVGLLRAGVPQREAAALAGVATYQAERLSVRLGIKVWREESKRRAARSAVYDGRTPRQLAADYTAVHPGADAMGVRRARELMAEVRAAEGLV